MYGSLFRAPGYIQYFKASVGPDGVNRPKTHTKPHARCPKILDLGRFVLGSPKPQVQSMRRMMSFCYNKCPEILVDCEGSTIWQLLSIQETRV